jgi:ABC-type polysaccharide/polyol phosphate export permease
MIGSAQPVARERKAIRTVHDMPAARIGSRGRFARLPRGFGTLLSAPLAKPRLWTTLAWIDVVQSYRRTMLGPAWITLNLIIFTVAMTLVYGALFGVTAQSYSAYLLCGMIGWFWVAALVTDLGNTFVNHSHFLKSTAIDKSILIWSAAAKQVIVLGHHLVVYAVFVALQLVELSSYTLLAIPVLALLFLLSIPVTAVLCILFTRYRDLHRLVSSLIIVLLLITPVFWQAEMITGWRTAVIDLNPLHYLIEILRAPLLGRPPDLLVVGVVLAMTIVAWLAGAALYRRYERYVVFWL